MKPISPTPHDPLDELLAAALHGGLTAAERAALDARLAADPAARAAYQEIQHMHDLLEKNYRDAQPDPAFEERMISGVRRKVRAEKAHRETAWESALILWRAVKRPFVARPVWTWSAVGTLAIVALILAATVGRESPVFATRPINKYAIIRDGETAMQGQLVTDNSADQRQQQTDQPRSSAARREPPVMTQSGDQGTLEAIRVFPYPVQFDAGKTKETAIFGHPFEIAWPTHFRTSPTTAPALAAAKGSFSNALPDHAPGSAFGVGGVAAQLPSPGMFGSLPTGENLPIGRGEAAQQKAQSQDIKSETNYAEAARKSMTLNGYVDSGSTFQLADATAKGVPASPSAPGAAAAEPSRKLIRNAQLDLEVKNYQKAIDDITTLTKANGGYVDSSDSQRGGNDKLQGTVVVKVLPENLDPFLLKLRALGEIKNQSVSTEDVTKAYYDTQARLDNSRRMETQLQLLLARDNGKVSDLLEVERELGRVRGDIETMQGQLKLYDFQVQYATVTIALAERDLNQAAAYLLRENDNFSLFARDVEDAFAQAKTAAGAFKAEILSADLQHNAGSDMTARMVFSVPPDQIDGFLARVRSLGRVDNFTRQTQRVANDGGDTSAPADQTRTEKAPVQVELAIRSDDESPRQQTQLAIVSAGDIDTQAQQVKTDAVQAGATVTGSDFQRAPDGTETATITFRLALGKVGDFMPVLDKLGRVESLTVQRDDRPDQPAADPNAPAEITLRLHNQLDIENETPRQQTQLAIVTTGDVDAQARQVKSDALKAGMAVTASSFERAPDGTETAAITFRLPMTRAAAFTTTLEKLGRVESLAVQRNDAPGGAADDPNAAAEIGLQLHNEPALVASDKGLWPTLRRTFGGGIAAFLGSVQTIGVIVAFLLPWLVALAVAAWIGRRIYVARKR